MAKKYRYNQILMKCLFGEEKMKTKKTKEWSNFFKISLSGHILKKSTHSHFGAWSFILVHIHVTPSEGPKGFVDFIF